MAKKKAAAPGAPAAPTKKLESSSSSKKSLLSKLTWKQQLSIVVPVVAVVLLRSSGSNPLTYLDASNEAQLREVFFSSQAVWAVACADKDGAPPEAWEAVAARLKSHEATRFGVLDCAAKLPSGRTILQRWKLKASEVPIIFVANGVQVTQIPASAARSEYDLVRELRLAAVRRPSTLTSTAAFKEKCLAKPRCLLVLQGGVELEPSTSKAVDALMGRYSATVSFATLDSSDWKLDFEGFDDGDKAKLRRYEPGSHRFIYFQNTTASSEVYAVAYHKGAFSESAFASFLDQLQLKETTNDLTHLVGPLDDVSIVKRPKPKRKPLVKPETTTTTQKPPPKDSTKKPEILSDEDRRRLKEEQQDRETRAREKMSSADSAYVPEEADDDDDDENDVLGDVDVDDELPGADDDDDDQLIDGDLEDDEDIEEI